MGDFVFISYSSEDKKIVSKIEQSLNNARISTWRDIGNLRGGDRWAMEIFKGIESSALFIVILSNKSVESKYVKQEILNAIAIQESRLDSRFIIPIKISDCKIEFPELQDLQIINYYPNEVEAISKLIGIIKDYKAEENTKIVGFDLGHGETSVAFTDSDAHDEPKILEIADNKKSIITALCFSEEEGILIGDEALLNSANGPINIMFNSADLRNKGTHDLILNFIKECLKKLEDSGKIKKDEKTKFIFGHPSGWDDIVKKRYEKFLVEAELNSASISLVPEARAAFLNALESGELNDLDRKTLKNVLIIDIGSLTTDFVLVRDLISTPIDIGYNSLGAGLIDILIFSYFIDQSLDEEKLRFKKIFDSDRNAELRCIVKCRIAKERYFRKDESFWESQAVSENYVFEEDNLVFRIRLFKKDMENIMNKPIESLNNESWGNAFRNRLIDVKMKIHETPELILITGGASGMPFTKAIVQQVFIDTKIKVSHEPSLSVSKGLAYVGKIDLKILKFRKEVKYFVEDSKKLEKIIEKNVLILVGLISSELSPIIIEIMTKVGIRWRQGQLVKIADYQDEANQVLVNYLKRDDMKRIYASVSINWIKQNLNPDIDNATRNLCKKYKIVEGSLNIVDPNEDLSIENIFSIDPMSESLNFGTAISQLIVSLVVGTAGITGLLTFNPIIVSVLMFLMIGLSYSKNLTPSLNIPVWFRQNLIFTSEEDVFRKMNKQKNKIEKELVDQFKTKFFSEDNISKIKKPIKKMLEESAEKASLLIK